ncbi:MAG: putative lipid II flippase FtsW [Eubacteriales bacterium]|nr:putative lipid II flippase FtsW [Eubacteriales bacterium]
MPKRNRMDYIMLVCCLGLVIFGLVMVFSASYYTSQSKGGNGTYFLIKQITGAALGVGVLLVCAFVPVKWFDNLAIPGFLIVVSIGLLIWALTKDAVNGAKRWVEIAGQSVQPSEIGRVAVMYFTAVWLSRHQDDFKSRVPRRFFLAILPPLAVVLVIFLLIILGSNLSMAASTLILFMLMLVVGGINGKAFGMLSGAGGVAVVLLAVLEPYRLKRMLIFTDPFKDPQKTGYQLVQSLYALGSGGLFGVGLGNSRQKYLYLPYSESDFILSIIGEEFGFVGMIILMIVFWIFIWRGFVTALRAPDAFMMLMATGIVALVAIQLIINVAVITASMPPTGVPLPFISAGNSSLIVFMAATGILLNISRYSHSA